MKQHTLLATDRTDNNYIHTIQYQNKTVMRPDYVPCLDLKVAKTSETAVSA